jgi:hypothetical protein
MFWKLANAICKTNDSLARSAVFTYETPFFAIESFHQAILVFRSENFPPGLFDFAVNNN